MATTIGSLYGEGYGGLVSDWADTPMSMGTTLLAVEFNGGVVVGADSRATTGSYIANRIADKLTKVTDKIYCCRSGSSADTQAITDIVKFHLDFHQIHSGLPTLVQSAANVFRDLCYQYRDQLSAGIIVAGWDEQKGGQVYAVPIGGMIARQTVAAGGSGSTYIYGYLDSQFKEGMSKEECLEFVTKGVALAMLRDGSSGGVVRLAAITKDGVERHNVFGDKLPRFYEQ